MDNRVYVLKVENYESGPLQNAMRAIWHHLNLELELSGKSILVKPNMLVGAPPDKAVCTHPEVVRAVLRQVLSNQVFVGDSPGFGSTSSVAQAAGISDVCREEGVQLIDFTDPQTTKTPQQAQIHSLPLASAVLRADAVVNIAKLKTHGLTRYTGAVKNLFGCLPGKLKAQMHLRMEEIDRFADLLLDVYLTVDPVLSIVDGIVAMEGNGPRNGDPRHVGVLVAGRDAVAVDTVACKIVGIDPDTVPTIIAARRRGIGCSDLDKIQVIGAPLQQVSISHFKTVGGSHSALQNLPPFLKHLLREQLTAYPRVEKSCITCGICKHACPADAVTMGSIAEIQSSRCIRCYCCQEMCPEGAITLRRRGLGKLLK